MRVVDIMSDQTRALRIRSFVNFLTKNPGSGMYLQTGSKPSFCIRQYARPGEVEKLKRSHNWLSDYEVSIAAGYKTNLCPMSPEKFDLIEQHGYETALWNALVFSEE